MTKKLKIICLITLVILTGNIFISCTYSANYIKAPFYAIESYNEYNNISSYLNKDNHMYFQWGRVVRDSDDKLIFTTERKYISPYDNSKEYSFPGISSVNDFKAKAPKGKAFFSIFFNGTKTSKLTNNSDSLDLLNMSEDEWNSQIIEPAIAFASDHGFDGISLDFEGIKNNYKNTLMNDDSTMSFTNLKDKYTRLLKLFEAKLNGMPLTICVHPTNYNSYDGYDYKEINKICDFIILMGYDFQSNSVDGKLNEFSTQPYNKLEVAIKNMVNTGNIEPKKLILGMSLAVMKWYMVQDVKTQKIKYIKAPTSYKLEDVLKVNGDITFDTKTKTSVLTIDGKKANNADKTKYNTSSQRLLKVIYYFENEKSFVEKYTNGLLKKYSLGGLSIWRLGIGTSNTWKFILK